ncbi:MAG: PEP-CTERM sorting domain-containing protein [Armatimonadetes bacterium]|nr:PEP-CTERM sorting domain-containing protein [Armatimonadota bacterium]
MRFKNFALTGVLSVVVLTGSAANANLIVNGGFENQPNWDSALQGDSGYRLFSGSMIPGWTLEADHGATIHNTVLYPYISGNYSLNTDGEGWNGHNVDMYQDFASGAGQNYALSFDWKNWYSDNSPKLDVSVVDTVTSAVLAHGNYGVSAGLHNELFNFVGTGNALRLRVKCAPEVNYNDNTFIVDNFAVEAVPEPATILVVASGLLAAARRRRS